MFLYFIRLISFDYDECFVKIGISKNLNKRFAQIGRNYYVDCFHAEHYVTEHEAKEMETFLHKRLQKYKYNPSKKFSGFSECYFSEFLLEETPIFLRDKFSKLGGERWQN